jgi:hypothetical protein
MLPRDGNFLVLEGEELKKFSSSFKEIASLPTPLKLHGQPTDQRLGERSYLNPHYETWHMGVAPGGRVSAGTCEKPAANGAELVTYG